MVNSEMVMVQVLQTLLKPVAVIVQLARIQGNAGWNALTSLDRDCDRRCVQNLCCFDSSL